MYSILVAIAAVALSYPAAFCSDSFENSSEWLIKTTPHSKIDLEIQKAQSKSYVSSEDGSVMLVRRLFDGVDREKSKNIRIGLPDYQQLAVVQANSNLISSWLKKGWILQAEPNKLFKPLGRTESPIPLEKSLQQPNDTYRDLQWHLSRTGFDQIWNLVPELRNLRDRVLIFMADTWVDANHSDFEIDNFINPQAAREGLKAFHGTHVASIISSSTGNAHGISGAIWKASIVPVEVCGVYICDTSRIIEAIAFAADFDPDRTYAGKRVPRVLNLSLGSAIYSYQMANAIKYAQSKDVLVIAAAGNSSLPALAFYPASYPDVVSVGATDQDDQLTSFSNYGPRSLTLVAPGQDILAAVPAGTDYFAAQYGFSMLGQDFAYLNGTSMASPLVTAAAAIVRAFRPELRQDEVRRILSNAGTPIPALGYDGFFYKRLDAYSAVVQSAAVKTEPRAENNVEEDVVVDVTRSCHVAYNPTYPCENCILINGRSGNSDTQKTRIRWMFFNWLPVFPEPLAFSEVSKETDFHEEIEYFVPEYGNAGMQITNNFHFLVGFVEDRDSSGEVRSLKPVRFSNGETFFDIGRTPCP